jgi:hypothetical protein
MSWPPSPFSPPERFGLHAEGLGEATRHLAGVLADASHRWSLLQIDAAQAALAENAAYWRTWLLTAAGNADFGARWAALRLVRAQRHADLARLGFEQFAQLLSDLGQWGGAYQTPGQRTMQPGTPTVESAGGGNGSDGTGFVERRVAARLIFFPDRRMASSQSEAVGPALAASVGERTGNGRRRKAA